MTIQAINAFPRWLLGPTGKSERKITRHGELANFKEGLYQVGGNSYAWMVPNGSWGETNIGLIDGGTESALIDTCWDLKFTQEMLTASNFVLHRAPVEYVINTHADGDHCWGNQFFSGKNIIGTNACLNQMHHVSPGSLGAMKVLGRILRRIPGAGLNAFGHYMSTMMAPYDFRDIEVTPPNTTFTGTKSIKVGKTDLHIHEVGPGHTDGDAFVHVPDQDLVYAGDILFVNATPVLWAGPLENLLAGLDKLSGCKARVIVPGHGALATSKDVDQLREYWLFIQDKLYKGYLADKPPALAAREVALSADFQSRAFAKWDSPERILTNTYTLYRHWGAKLRSLPGHLSVMEIMRQQAMLSMMLPGATPKAMHSLSIKS